MTALELACHYQNQCCALEEILDMFCADAEAALQSAQPLTIGKIKSMDYRGTLDEHIRAVRMTEFAHGITKKARGE